MSAIVEKVTDAVNDVTAALGNTAISAKDDTTAADKSAHTEAVLASAAEGRRLYIGNLAYATTEGELQTFFKGYLMYVFAFSLCFSTVTLVCRKIEESLWQVEPPKHQPSTFHQYVDHHY